MSYWVSTARRHRVMSILGRVHAAFLTSHQMQEMIYMLDEIILARMMTVLHLELDKPMDYHNEGYESDKNYRLPPQVTRPVHIYSLWGLLQPSWIHCSPPPNLTLHSQMYQKPIILRRSVPVPILQWDAPLMPEMDSWDEEDLPTAYLDDPVWSEEPVPDGQECLAYMK